MTSVTGAMVLFRNESTGLLPGLKGITKVQENVRGTIGFSESGVNCGAGRPLDGIFDPIRVYDFSIAVL